MRRVAAALLVSMALTAGCGEDEPSRFAERAERACRAFGATFTGRMSLARAERLHAKLRRAVVRAQPRTDEEERAQAILGRFAEGESPTVSGLIAVNEAGLSQCAEVLRREPEVQVLG